MLCVVLECVIEMKLKNVSTRYDNYFATNIGSIVPLSEVTDIGTLVCRLMVNAFMYVQTILHAERECDVGIKTLHGKCKWQTGMVLTNCGMVSLK